MRRKISFRQVKGQEEEETKNDFIKFTVGIVTSLYGFAVWNKGGKLSDYFTQVYDADLGHNLLIPCVLLLFVNVLFIRILVVKESLIFFSSSFAAGLKHTHLLLCSAHVKRYSLHL